jgi:hypothetical protein
MLLVLSLLRRAILPKAESDLVQNLLKDPYHLDFLTLSTAGERGR